MNKEKGEQIAYAGVLEEARRRGDEQAMAADNATPTALARSYFDALRAPHKEFIPIEGAGHMAVIKHADRFLQLLAEHVRPVADSAAGAGRAMTPLHSGRND